MDPLISIRLLASRFVFAPGEQLQFEYQVDAVERPDLTAVEASVLWRTEGKGDEDIGVHFFERRKAAEEVDLRELHRCATVLPPCPLTYDGRIVKIRWCLRVRTFLKGRKEFSEDLPFQLRASAR